MDYFNVPYHDTTLPISYHLQSCWSTRWAISQLWHQYIIQIGFYHDKVSPVNDGFIYYRHRSIVLDNNCMFKEIDWLCWVEIPLTPFDPSAQENLTILLWLWSCCDCSKIGGNVKGLTAKLSIHGSCCWWWWWC